LEICLVAEPGPGAAARDEDNRRHSCGRDHQEHPFRPHHRLRAQHGQVRAQRTPKAKPTLLRCRPSKRLALTREP
jgi:hypothetical protein